MQRGILPFKLAAQANPDRLARTFRATRTVQEEKDERYG